MIIPDYVPIDHEALDRQFALQLRQDEEREAQQANLLFLLLQPALGLNVLDPDADRGDDEVVRAVQARSLAEAQGMPEEAEQANEALDNYVFLNFLSPFWRNVTLWKIPFMLPVYLTGSACYAAFELPLRVVILVKEVFHILGTPVVRLARWDFNNFGRDMQIRLVVLTGSTLGVANAAIGVACPPLAHCIDEDLNSWPTYHEHAVLSLWAHEVFRRGVVRPEGLGFGRQTEVEENIDPFSSCLADAKTHLGHYIDESPEGLDPCILHVFVRMGIVRTLPRGKFDDFKEAVNDPICEQSFSNIEQAWDVLKKVEDWPTLEESDLLPIKKLIRVLDLKIIMLEKEKKTRIGEDGYDEVVGEGWPIEVKEHLITTDEAKIQAFLDESSGEISEALTKLVSAIKDVSSSIMQDGGKGVFSMIARQLHRAIAL